MFDPVQCTTGGGVFSYVHDQFCYNTYCVCSIAIKYVQHMWQTSLNTSFCDIRLAYLCVVVLQVILCYTQDTHYSVRSFSASFKLIATYHWYVVVISMNTLCDLTASVLQKARYALLCFLVCTSDASFAAHVSNTVVCPIHIDVVEVSRQLLTKSFG